MAVKVPKLDLAPCPACGMKAAISKSKAHSAYHSKYFAKLRKTKKEVIRRKGPQVGRLLTVEEAMLDPKFADRVRSTESANAKANDDDDALLWKIGSVMTVLLGLFAAFLGYSREAVTFVVLVVFGVIFAVEIKLIDWDIRRSSAWRNDHDNSWLCLKCGHEWIARANIN